MKKISFLKQINGPDPNFKDICFSGAGRYFYFLLGASYFRFILSGLIVEHLFFCARDVTELPKVFPEVDMVFADGQKISLSPENYLFRVFIFELIFSLPLSLMNCYDVSNFLYFFVNFT